MNEFKRSLSGDRPLIGFWLTMGDSVSAEVCAGAGFDWVVIDAEHGPYDSQSVLAVLQVLGGYPECAPVVRVPTGEPWLVAQYLDAGATTVLVPMIDTAEQARAAVSACRYPPAGIRGVGGARASRWGRHRDYLAEANDEVCVLVQVETVAAMANLGQILKVEGIDGVFVGPADLAASMGHPGQPAHPDVQAAITTALSQIHDAGLPSGTLATVEDTAHAYVDRGVRFVAVGIDAHLLARHTEGLVKRFAPSEASGEVPDAHR